MTIPSYNKPCPFCWQNLDLHPRKHDVLATALPPPLWTWFSHLSRSLSVHDFWIFREATSLKVIFLAYSRMFFWNSVQYCPILRLYRAHMPIFHITDYSQDAIKLRWSRDAWLETSNFFFAFSFTSLPDFRQNLYITRAWLQLAPQTQHQKAFFRMFSDALL